MRWSFLTVAIWWAVFTVPLLLGLSIAKFVLVVGFFMHLKFDGWKLIAIVTAPTILAGIIIVLTFPDIAIDWPSIY